MATRSTAERTRARHTWAQPVPSRAHRRRFRRLRRVVATIVIAGILLFTARAYVLHVYAPGLRAEARTVPVLVQQQLASHGDRYVTIDRISPNLRHAIVAIEDWRFYYHPGVDPLGIARALWVNVRKEHVDQGGSTLEEQLVKRAIVHDDSTIHAKLRTMALAWAVDQEFSKQKILEEYLNEAYYGQGAYGVGAAARVYFGTDAARLTLPQAAFLAALPQAPSIYGDHPTAPEVVARKNTVLSDLAKYGYISSDQATAAQNVRLTFALPNP
ncbi:MAG TPA: biosynthetic peptidoglycan transglycosylase [Chloroflexota bacterium]